MFDWNNVDWSEGARERGRADRTPRAFLDFQLDAHGLTMADVRIAPRVVVTFQSYIYADLVRLTGASRSAAWHRLVEPLPLAQGRYRGAEVTVVHFPIGAPAAVSFLEQLAICGGRTLVAFGTAGGLRHDAPNGCAVLPTRAIRQEGTSYHYCSAAVEAVPDHDLLTHLRDACGRRNVPAREGIVWTTDAPFREIASEVRRFAERDVLAVDMESSALFVVGALRGLRVASLFIVSDELFHPWIPARVDGPYRETATRLAECSLDAVAHPSFD